MESDDAPPTVVTPQATLAPTVQRPHRMAAAFDVPTEKPGDAPTEKPTGPTLLLNQERLLSQVPRITHEGKEAPVLGGIPLLSKIGQGGMGAVYYGICPKSKTPIAVKVLPLQLGDQTQAVDRFLREARLATVVKSPHLVAVLDVGHDNGLYYFQMEFVRGKSAGGYMRTVVAGGKTGMDEGTALDICIAATRGLAAAHEANIIHRDIKPDNILLPEDSASTELHFDQAKLADLGLARSLSDDQTMTATQTALGTPGYMAPEQCRDAKRAEMAADIFSMGATLYAFLTGRPPFQGRTSVDTILATLTRQHLPVKQFRDDVSEMTCEVIERCLSKEPRIRYENAGKLLEALLTCQDLRRGMSTLGLGLRAPVAGGATVRDVSLPPLAKTVVSPHAHHHTPVFVPKRRGPNVFALGLGAALLAGGVAWILMPPQQDEKKPASGVETIAAPQLAPAPVANPIETVVPTQTPAPRTETPAPNVAVQPLKPAFDNRTPLQRIHEDAAKAVLDAAAKQNAEEDQRRAKIADLKKQDYEASQAKADKLGKDADAARTVAEKAKGEFDLAQKNIEQLQNEERAMKDQFVQMDMKMRQMPPPQNKQPPPRPKNGQQPPPPQQDPRVQQMIGQMNEMQLKLRDKMNLAQTQFRDKSQALNKATYDMQKADGMAKMAADDALRMKDRMND